MFFTGFNFKFSGIIVKGKGVGKTIGFPTANISIENKNKTIPKRGVYAVSIYWNKYKLKGMLNIGTNPTINNGKKTCIEVNIFDFNKSIYNTIITIEVISRIRNEKRFKTIDELKNQLALDKIAALNMLD